MKKLKKTKGRSEAQTKKSQHLQFQFALDSRKFMLAEISQMVHSRILTLAKVSARDSLYA